MAKLLNAEVHALFWQVLGHMAWHLLIIEKDAFSSLKTEITVFVKMSDLDLLLAIHFRLS